MSCAPVCHYPDLVFHEQSMSRKGSWEHIVALTVMLDKVPGLESASTCGHTQAEEIETTHTHWVQPGGFGDPYLRASPRTRDPRRTEMMV